MSQVIGLRGGRGALRRTAYRLRHVRQKNNSNMILCNMISILCYRYNVQEEYRINYL